MVLLGKRIKEQRNRAKLTQTELAQRVGVTKSTIAAYENDSRQPSYEVLIKMADVFKVSTDFLLINHPGTVLEVHDLDEDQIRILKILIAYFRRSNIVEDFFAINAPKLHNKLEEYVDMRTNGIEGR